MSETANALAAAASDVQQKMGQQAQGLTGFGPQPLVQPPPMVRPQPAAPVFAQPQGSFGSVGERKRADRQAVIGNIANMVKTGADYIQNKKSRALSMDIERLMSAQQGMEEAKAALQQNPNDPKAKQALEQNTSIVNDLTSDPKKNKQFQKAFNIDLFGNGKNKQENQALVKAWQDFQQKQQAGDKTALNPAAQRLMQSQPVRQQLDPAAAQQAQAIKMGLIPGADTVLKASVENFKALSAAKTAEERNVALENAAKIRAEAVTKHADKLIDAMTLRVAGQQAVAEINSRTRKYIVDRQTAETDKKIQMLAGIAGGNKYAKELNTQYTGLNNELKANNAANKADQIELDKYSPSYIGKLFGTSAASTPDAKRLRYQIQQRDLRNLYLTGKISDINKALGDMHTIGLIPTPGESTGEEGVNPDDPDNIFPTAPPAEE